MLGRKQKEKNANFEYVWSNIEKIIPKDKMDLQIKERVSEMKKILSGKKWGLAWSAGKDSVVIEFLALQVGEHPTCIGITDELEYPEFMQFVTNNMPEDLTVYNSGHTMKWLGDNLDMLFPKDSKIAAKWFSGIQHKAQNSFFKEKELDILVTGRRKLDMNYVGPNGLYKNNSTNVVRYSPIHDWSHEQIIACMKYYDLPKAPFYNWENGWIVGSGCWAARQWTGTIEQAWRQIYVIDKSVVENAAIYIESAKEFLNSRK